MNPTWECAVVGGGAAGLSGALVLGRARRRTLVVDSGRQSNLPAHGIGGLLGHDGRNPADFYKLGIEELKQYPSIDFLEETVEEVTGSDGDFSLVFSDGSSASADKVILAGGMDYEVESLDGIEKLWGRSVFHCPFCHGWEMRDRHLAVRGNGERGIHGALLLRGWSEDVVLLTDGPSELEAEELNKLEAAGVRVEQRKIAGLLAEGSELLAVAFADGPNLSRDGLLLAPRLRQRTGLTSWLGVRLAPENPMSVDAIEVDAMQRTSVPGVFAAGDVAGGLPQVAAAVASGSMSGSAAVQSILADQYGLPVPAAAAR